MEDHLSTGWLIVILVCLLFLSAFFSGTETALMRINRFRLRHKAEHGSNAAKQTEKLLTQPDRLISVILLGNNFVNISASALITLIANRLAGGLGVFIATAVFTIVLVIFAELIPKTIAIFRAYKISLFSSYIYRVLLIVFFPLVWLINTTANLFISAMGIEATGKGPELDRDELRTVVGHSTPTLPTRGRAMLMSVLDLETVTVDDILVPRSEITAIDLSDDWEKIIELLRTTRYTRLPVINEDFDQLIGVIHMRNIVQPLVRDELTTESLKAQCQGPIYVPEGTALSRQLLAFQSARQRLGFVIDEYGDVMGLITLEDILEEIVGEFTTDPYENQQDVAAGKDGSFLVSGSANIRILNRKMKWSLPTDEQKTLNGLITEQLETIPQPGMNLSIGGYLIEILKAQHNLVKTARITPMERSEVIDSP